MLALGKLHCAFALNFTIFLPFCLNFSFSGIQKMAKISLDFFFSISLSSRNLFCHLLQQPGLKENHLGSYWNLTVQKNDFYFLLSCVDSSRNKSPIPL